jgi:uncharacterized protein
MKGTFLTAEWRMLVMASHAVDPALLLPHVPRGTELDARDGVTLASVVGFRFLATRLLGVPVPLHRDFEELNLRFYVRRRGPEGWRRGVVFVKEIVPRRAIAAVARLAYNENYVAMPMRHAIERSGDDLSIEYGWRRGGRWESLRTAVRGEPSLPAEGSDEEFVTEHYWGYARQRDGGTLEYRVEHPRWRCWTALTHALDADPAGLYGAELGAALTGAASSVLVAEGSAVAVGRPVRIA